MSEHGTPTVDEAFFLVPGQPRGKGRPRFNGKSGRTYTDRRTDLAEARVERAWEQAGSPRLHPGPVELTVFVVLERPAAHRRRDGSLSKAGQRTLWPTRKPDVDNVLKLVMDALNGCAYGDDASVVYAAVTKRWAVHHLGEREGLRVSLRSLAVVAAPPVEEAA